MDAVTRVVASKAGQITVAILLDEWSRVKSKRSVKLMLLYSYGISTLI